ncbi:MULTISPECIES: helix-turn-helix transcriptional regulator [unclassified Streptomyces]|uniref:Helix-turn-helix transcriptional regulator n=1 Tax=Streptomyces evansiae TaxID=3075535 RepID=A0ABU2R7F3_9ACTN|nr:MULTISPECIES: helix-turn-helix transcriptional regulator [unclassified Streptomyces]MDT0411680.1 helix-turn-helix transcriptional regulator [Streptomyces sp. DSM 41979]MYQ57901.1 helix-turn-helix domain-containing protein [Streptomyces sp. SID4926]MYR29092.1 helix-turn-helix domain-containing protein [Streptomyces sp. SID4945]SCD48782.1 Helix-turn-helix domain-containing protein [Streptomyces sp. DfronAA-171]SCD73925.1 Helix-turn-helix domain-containing protein [Streptomyces sp. TverLS-915]
MTNVSPGDPLRLLTWQYFGEELRRLREAAGLTQADLAELVFVSASYIAQFEAGRRKPMEDVAKRLDQALKTNGTFWRIIQKLIKDQGPFPPFALPFFEMEREAVAVNAFEATRVPGILQTRRYADAIFRASRPFAPADDPEIEELIKARVQRAALLSGPKALQLWVVIHETALHTPVGGPDVLREQLRHLADCVLTKKAVIQVLPFTAGAIGASVNPFALFRFEDTPPVLYTEALSNSIVRDEPETVEYAFEVYAGLRSAALSPETSLELISSLTQGTQADAHAKQLG